MPQRPNSVVLINGLWMTALSWEHWVERYSERGYRLIARSWPGMEGDIEELRRDPSAIAGLGLGEIVDHYEGIIQDLDVMLRDSGWVPERPDVLELGVGAGHQGVGPHENGRPRRGGGGPFADRD